MQALSPPAQNVELAIVLALGILVLPSPLQICAEDVGGVGFKPHQHLFLRGTMSNPYLGEVSIVAGGGGGYLGEVSITGGGFPVPAGDITGLTPNLVCIGAADGSLTQTSLAYTNANGLVINGLGGASSIAVGADVGENDTCAVGFLALISAGATAAAAFGNGSQVTAASGTAIGAGAKANAARGSALGNGATVNFQDSIAIGAGATPTATNQLMIGSSLSSVSVLYIGNGERSTVPQAIQYRATSGLGADVAGATMTFSAGQGTGSASGGSIALQSSLPAGAGNTLRALYTFNTWNGLGNETATPGVAISGTPTHYTLTGAAHTGLTASAEITDVNYNLARTVQRATGAVATQRAFLIQAPTYSFVGASTITNAATLAISGAPIVGANAVITNPYALWIQSGIARFDGGIDSPGSGGSASLQAGRGASASNASTTAIGASAAASGNAATALGNAASASSTGGIAIGTSASSAHSRAIVLGLLGVSTAANQFVVFFNDTVVSSMYLGNGVVAASPANTSLNASGGSGANIAGATLGINGGISTGTGAGGAITFSTSKAAGGSSSVANTLTERVRIDSLGNVGINASAAGATAERVLALGNASVVDPTTSVDLAQLYAKDESAGNCTLAVFTEKAPVTEVVVADTSILVFWNGAKYKLLARLVP